LERYRECSKIVLVDFDGTLCEFRYPDLGPPIQGARQFMKALIARGLQPVVWSSRMSGDVNTDEERRKSALMIRGWLIENGIPFHDVDDGTQGKRHCLAYVDDRGAQFTGSYERVLSRIDYIKNHHNAQVALDRGADG